MASITEQEYKIIEKQLNREPENLAEIVCRCPQNKPVVLKVYPYSSNGCIFPTTYWLSCPFYFKEVARLEDQGYIKMFSSLLQKDENLTDEMEKIHDQYARERYLMLTEKNLSDIKKLSPDILKVLRDSGVGGIRDRSGIKCLHTHLADFLVNRSNPIGRYVKEMLPPVSNCFKKTESENREDTGNDSCSY